MIKGRSPLDREVAHRSLETAWLPAEQQQARRQDQVRCGMPLTVGNIVLLNSGSPPMTVKAITHAGQVLCQWIDFGASCTRWNLRPKCCRTSTRHRGQTNGAYPRSPTEQCEGYPGSYSCPGTNRTSQQEEVCKRIGPMSALKALLLIAAVVCVVRVPPAAALTLLAVLGSRSIPARAKWERSSPSARAEVFSAAIFRSCFQIRERTHVRFATSAPVRSATSPSLGSCSSRACGAPAWPTKEAQSWTPKPARPIAQT